MKGGSLKVYEVKAFLNASYEPGAPIKYLTIDSMKNYLIYMVKFMLMRK